MTISFQQGSYYGTIFDSFQTIAGTTYIEAETIDIYYNLFFILGFVPIIFTIVVSLALVAIFIILIMMQITEKYISEKYN